MMKKRILVLCIGLFMLFLGSEKTFAITIGEKRTFLVSAYYSPLPDQKNYAFGTYEADKKMNGEGIAGADGTPVYVGMIAAPKNYPFGTKIDIPGLGVGCVHDRGGAIVASANFDRLDVWMGYGDEGLKRAMNWGMRTVVGTIVPNDTPETLTLGEKVSISVVVSPPKSSVVQEKQKEPESATLSLGDSGKSVTNLQQFLYDHGFMDEKPTGYFGEKTKAAVFSFQQFYRIVSSESDPGAGVFGPKTRAKLEAVWNDDYNLKTLPTIPETLEMSFPVPLEKGSQGDEVKKLQRALQGLGYFSEKPNGVFGPATQQAVISFQKDYLLIANEHSEGAGKVGPKTGGKLQEVLKMKKIKIIANDEKPVFQ